MVKVNAQSSLDFYVSGVENVIDIMDYESSIAHFVLPGGESYTISIPDTCKAWGNTNDNNDENDLFPGLVIVYTDTDEPDKNHHVYHIMKPGESITTEMLYIDKHDSSYIHAFFLDRNETENNRGGYYVNVTGSQQFTYYVSAFEHAINFRPLTEPLQIRLDGGRAYEISVPDTCRAWMGTNDNNELNDLFPGVIIYYSDMDEPDRNRMQMAVLRPGDRYFTNELFTASNDSSYIRAFFLDRKSTTPSRGGYTLKILDRPEEPENPYYVDASRHRIDILDYADSVAFFSLPGNQSYTISIPDTARAWGNNNDNNPLNDLFPGIIITYSDTDEPDGNHHQYHLLKPGESIETEVLYTGMNDSSYIRAFFLDRNATDNNGGGYHLTINGSETFTYYVSALQHAINFRNMDQPLQIKLAGRKAYEIKVPEDSRAWLGTNDDNELNDLFPGVILYYSDIDEPDGNRMQIHILRPGDKHITNGLFTASNDSSYIHAFFLDRKSTTASRGGYMLDILVSIDAENKYVIGDYDLYQNFPNPFNPVTTIGYKLSYRSDVKIILYDALGRKVKTVVNDVRHAGYHSVELDMSAFASGVYYYSIQTADFARVRKMLLIK